MKIGIFLVLVIATAYAIGVASAQTSNEVLDYRFLPSKLIEDSEGIIQIFVQENNEMVPLHISGLTATSLDSSILRVVEVKESDDNFISEIKIKAVKPGQTKIFLAASDFSSIEIPVTVYGNKLHSEQLFIKALPTVFSEDSPNFGYVSVELADEDGFPVIALEPTVITLSSSDEDVVNLLQRDIIIEKGEYYAFTKFEILNNGEATIYATTSGLPTVKSEAIKVAEEDEDLGIKLYLIPDKVNVFSSAQSFIIAQLIDESGDPVIAKKDVIVNYIITNSQFTGPSNFSSNQNQLGDIKNQGYFVIKEGTYWGYTEFTALSGIEDTYTIVISSKDPLGVDSGTIQTENFELLDDKLVKFEDLPILATGNRELIGVTYLQDENGNPILADKDIFVKISSSDHSFLKVEDSVIPYGFGSGLVFGQVGYSIPDDLQLHAQVEESKELIEAEIFGPEIDTHRLTVEPLITKVLVDTEFPIIAFMQDETSITQKRTSEDDKEETIDVFQVVEFPEPGELFVSPNESIMVDSQTISKGNDIVILNAKSINKGTETLYFQINDYEEDLKIQSLSIQPSTLQIDHSETFFSGKNEVFSIQLLDSTGLPVFANKDIEIKLVATDNSIIEYPETVTISKGEYFAMFDVAAKSGGSTELSALAPELQLVTEDVNVVSLSPIVELSTPTLIEKDAAFDAVLTVKANNNPISGSNIEWIVNGAIVQISDSKTDANGNAKISLIGTDERNVKITAAVKDSFYDDASVSKNITVNYTSPSEFMVFAEEEVEQEFEQIEIFGFDPVLVFAPVALAVVGYMLRKKGMLKVKN